MSIAGGLALLLLAGGDQGVFQRRHFSLRWLLAAAVLVALNDFLLTDGYRLIPNLSHGFEWNWQGKVLALAATLAVAALPAFGRRRCGLTLVQAPGWWQPALPVAILDLALFVV